MTRTRLSPARVERLLEQLSVRDRAIVTDLARVRVLTGDQLTRLHFSDLSAASRDRTRRRVLARLADLGVVATLERRIGGVRAGSAGLVFAVGVAGQHLLPLLSGAPEPNPTRRARRPWTTGRLFLAHSLAVSELFVRLTETARTDTIGLAAYETEPASWVPNGLGGWLKPDASTVLYTGTVEDSWWIEVDRATESLPTLQRKLEGYLDFVHRGQLGPDGVIPRILVTVPDDRRYTDVCALLDRLPEPANQLMHLTIFEQAPHFLVQALRA